MTDKGSLQDFARIVERLLPGIHRPLLLFTLAAFVYELLKFVPVFLVKVIIDNIFGQPQMQHLLWLVGGIFLSLIILTVIELRFLVFMAELSATQQKKLLERSFNKLVVLPLSWHERQNTGSLISKLTKAASYVHQLIWFIGENIIPISLQIILTGVVLLWIDWRIGVIYAAFTVLLLFMINWQFKAVQPLRQQYHHAYEESAREFAQALYNVQTVKDYAQEERESHTHSSHLQQYLDLILRRTNHEFRSIALRDTLTNVVRALTIGLAVYFVIDGSLTPGDLVLVFTLTEKAYINLHRLGRVYSFMGDTHEALDRALEVQETLNALPDSGTKRLSAGSIEFNRVDFSYGEALALRSITLRIVKGKTTALVGASGSGKTTLVKLITRQYDPTKGLITINGIDIRDVPLRVLRKRIAFVSQHTEVFDRTVAENISYGRPNASRAEIIRAAKQANAHEFITKLSKGYDTLVGERGVRLSGGQRQRVSIARALLADPDIIIFDEATSSLDSESERAIQQALFSIKGKTLIIIAHRFSTIEHADAIVVLKDGRIAETGTHHDLMKQKSGIYRRMRKLQELGELRA